MAQLTKADHKLFRGTAAEVHSWMSNKDILKSIGCDFDVNRIPHTLGGREFPEVQLWHRSDNQNLLGVFGSRRQCIQPETFIQYFRDFCDVSQKEINLDLVGSLDGGKTFYMASKLTQNQNTELEKVGDKTDSWLVVTDYYGESKAPKVMVLFNELICTNGMTKQISQRFRAFSHLKEMKFDDVAPVLDSALAQSKVYADVKDKLINTPISMDSAKEALRTFFTDPEGDSSKVKILEDIYQNKLIGGELETRNGTAWGLMSAATQHSSHSRAGNGERTLRSQLDGSRGHFNTRFMNFLESQFLSHAIA